MGLLDKITKKIGNAIEKAASKNLTGASKEEYEKYKAEKEKAASEKPTENNISASYSGAELKNLDSLIQKVNAVDEQNLWIAGFPNFKVNQNAIAANLFSGKKNLKFLTYNNGTFYLLRLDNGEIGSYRIFKKENVASVEVSGMMTKSFKVTFKDGTNYSVDVTENKDKIASMKAKLM